MKKIVSFLIIFVICSCAADVRVELTKDDVQFVAVASGYEDEIHGGHKVLGQLKITSSSEGEIAFSNKELYLVIKGEGESRTYVDSIASHAIDFTSTTLKKGGTLKQNVYWVLPPVKSLTAEHLHLEWRKYHN